MQILGTLVFGAMTAINLTLLGLIVAGLFRRIRVHH